MPKESHGQRSLLGYTLWGRKESDMTEQLTVSNLQNKYRYDEEVSLIFLSTLVICAKAETFKGNFLSIKKPKI